jgi:hypothetical protein
MDDEDDVMQVMRKGFEMPGFEIDAKCNPPDALVGFEAGVHDMSASGRQNPPDGRL